MLFERSVSEIVYTYLKQDFSKGGDQGRVDDIWGALYTLIELRTAKLPWAGKHPNESCKIKAEVKDSELFNVSFKSIWWMFLNLN